MILVAGAAVPARAQVPAGPAVTVLVVDSAGAPIARGQVTAIRGLSSVVARCETDVLGACVLRVPEGDFQLVVRRIGYKQDMRFLAARDSVQVSVRVRLERAPQLLPAITVHAEADVKRRSYHIDAEEIATSDRPIYDGLDILTKLRPFMINPRAATKYSPCPTEQVFVNGMRQTNVPRNDAVAVRMEQLREVSAATVHWTGTSMLKPPHTERRNTVEWLPPNVIAVLTSIRPEHIEEINYTDCMDATSDKLHGSSAVYVALKTGVAFEPGVGSYVAEPPKLRAAAATPRVLGVFDEAGQPIANAIVLDSATRESVLTSETGTVSLAFLTRGEHTLEVSKENHVAERVHVMISEGDAAPVTILMWRRREH